MIYEVRTYIVKPGSVAKLEESVAEALHIRLKYSPLGGYFHTEFGPLNQVVHIWPYEDLKHRTEARAAAWSDPSGKWPPKVQDLIVSMNVEILLPAPFMRPLDGKSQQLGSIYELRTYTYQNGAMPKVLERFAAGIGYREQLSPLALCGYTEFGNLNRFMHLWPYKDFAQRTQVRATMRKPGMWPPDTHEWLISQENKLLMPAAFSPLH